MKTKDRKKNIASKKPEDLNEFVKEKREVLRTIRFSQGGSKVKNVREIREIKRDIARALTKSVK